MAKHGKRLRKTYEGIDRDVAYKVAEAVKLIKDGASSKFDETIEVALNLGLDTRHADQTVRGAVTLPHGTGKALRVAVFAKDAKAEEAKKAGADLVGGDDLAAEVQKGEIDFDRVIATPDMMPVVGKLGKILGPRGLMPNPKLGTVTTDVAEAIAAAKGGQVQYRTEKAGVVHAGIGKASFSEAAIEENLRAFVKAINQAKPSGSKGTYLKKVCLSSTMGPGVKLDISDLVGASTPAGK